MFYLFTGGGKVVLGEDPKQEGAGVTHPNEILSSFT